LFACVSGANVHSIYKEIGPGRRVALSKLAVEKYEETGRPLRIAIDTSIWLFQIQASKGRALITHAMKEKLIDYRRDQSCAANLLLSPPPPHRARYPPSLRLRWPE
jgi:hypothetical protein